MLQRGDVLATWSLAESPAPESSQEAERLADHRPAYLDYEGPVSGNRGHVERWDEGSYQVTEWTDERIVVHLTGAQLSGEITLTRLGGGRYRWTARGVN